MGGIKGKGVVVGAGELARSGLHAFPAGFSNRFPIVDQLRGAELGFAAAIEIGPPGHLGFPVVEGQQMGQQALHPPAHAPAAALLLGSEQFIACGGRWVALQCFRQLGQQLGTELLKWPGLLALFLLRSCRQGLLWQALLAAQL